MSRELPDSAGLRPDRAYFGIHRPITVTVDMGPGTDGPTRRDARAPIGEAPASMSAEPGASVLLLDPADSLERPLAVAPIKPIWAEPTVRGETGAVLQKVDLADMFPMLWTLETPRVLLVQLQIDGRRRGAPMVLQPMVAPSYASKIDRAGNPSWTEPDQRRRTYSGVRAYVGKMLVMDTSVGQMEFALRPDLAPNTVWHLMSLVRDGFYTDIGVHRIASLTGGTAADIVQAGDPLGTGLGGPGFYADLEPSTLAHEYGVLSMARTGEPNSIGSQFFICLSRDGTMALDGKYTSVGRLVKGAETLGAIAKSPVGADQKPLHPPVIRRMWLVDAPPAGQELPPLKDPFAPSGER